MSDAADRLAGHPRIEPVRAAAAEARAWVVGGSVRDALLGRPLVDVDVVVDGDPGAFAAQLRRRLGGPSFKLSDAFGAWRVLAHDRSFRCDVSALHGGSIEADLAGRDFSVNAIAAPLAGGALVDPEHGEADLRRGLLRVLGGDSVDSSAYGADPLRPLRLARLATELGFEPDARTARLTREAAPHVPRAAPERTFAELRRLVAADGAAEGIELARGLGLVAAVLPELEALRGVEQSHFHHLDVYDHTLEVLRSQIALERDPDAVFGPAGAEVAAILAEPLADELTRAQALRFAALLHDVGKPATRAVRPDGRVTFIGHDRSGELMIGDLCRRLRTSERLREFLGAITRHHLALGFLVHARPLSRSAIYGYLDHCSPVEVEVTVLSCADRLATRGHGAEPAIAAHLDLARELIRAALDWRASGPARAPIRGDELARALGIAPGPELGTLMSALAEASFTGEATTAAEAIELARRLRGGR